MEENRSNTVAAKPNNSRWLIILLAALLLAGGLGYYFAQMNRPVENVVENIEPKSEEKREETFKDPEPDHTLINGYWKTETTEDGRFLEFTIDYPEVTNFNGVKGIVEYDAKLKRYTVTIEDKTGDSVFYLGDVVDNAGNIYYYENGEKDVKTLVVNRDPESAPENIIDKPKEQKTESGVSNSGNNKPSGNINNNEGKKGHYEERQVCVQEAYDEKVLVKKGECTSVLVKEAYNTEEMIYLEGAYYGPDTETVLICNQCGEIWTDDHMSETHRSWHSESRATSDPYWHNVEYKTVHHDAVYETQCEPDEYKTVHHEAEYKTEMVWVDD